MPSDLSPWGGCARQVLEYVAGTDRLERGQAMRYYGAGGGPGEDVEPLAPLALHRLERT